MIELMTVAFTCLIDSSTMINEIVRYLENMREKARKKISRQLNQGHWVNSNTLRTISNPVGICHMNSNTFSAFNTICRFLAVSFPFCIAGTRAAANAHKTVIPTIVQMHIRTEYTRKYEQTHKYYIFTMINVNKVRVSFTLRILNGFHDKLS